jgi:uncharacterized membrane protein YhaH (DUF805 family)
MSVTTPAVEAPPALSQPLNGASIVEAVTRFFKKYADFSGRASRSEFWWAYLAYVVIGAVIFIPLNALGVTSVTVTDDLQVVYGPGFWAVWTISLIVNLALILPSLALTWRRLHDSNKPGGFFFLSLIPFAGPIILIVLLALPSDPAGARFDR